MNIQDSLLKLWESTGIANFVQPADPAITNGVEQFLHQFGSPIMLIVCCFLLWLGIKKQYEPLLLVPIAFGGLLSNIPVADIAGPHGFLGIIYEAGIHQGLFPLIIFMGVGAMTDFGPLIANPKTALLGGAAQFGIFGALLLALCVFGFTLPQSAAIGIIGGADGPTAILTTSRLAEHLLPAISIAAYSYMALVPVIQPPIIKLLTTKKERQIKMTQLRAVSKTEKIIFPILVTTVVVLLIPDCAPLIGMLMLGNLIKESGVVPNLVNAAANGILYIVTILLGVCVGATANGETFLQAQTLFIIILGVIAFGCATAAGVLFGKIMCVATKGKVNPMIGAAGVSAVPMAARVVHKEGVKEDPTNFLLMHAMGPNVAGVIGSAIAAGILLTLFG